MKKLFLFCFLLLIVLPFANAGLVDGLVHYYGYNATDLVGSADGSACANAPTVSSFSKSGKSANFSKGGFLFAQNTITNTVKSGADWTINLWGYKVGSSPDREVFGSYNYASMFTLWQTGTDGGHGFFNVCCGWWSESPHLTVADLANGTWHMITVEWDYPNNFYVFADGNLFGQASMAGYVPWDGEGNDMFSWGAYLGACSNPDNSYHFNGFMSDFGVWNRILSADEITSLWSYGSGLFYPFIIPVYVLWDGYTPYNESVLTNVPVFFFNHTSIDNLNCSLWRNFTDYEIYQEFPLNLTGFWRFEEGSGSKAIDETLLYNGTIYEAIYNVSKGSNNTGSFSLEFDGTNDYVDVGDVDIDGNGTISAWIYPDTLSGSQAILFRTDTSSASKYADLSLNTYGNTLKASTGNNTHYQANIASGLTLSTKKWQFVAVVVDGTHIKFYKDNVGSGLINQTVIPAGNSYKYSVGKAGEVASWWFNGKIDEVAVFNRALNASEIQSIYNNGTHITQENITSGFVTIQNLTGVSGSAKHNFSDYSLTNGDYEMYVTCDNASSSHKFISVNGTIPKIGFLKIKNFYVNQDLVNNGVYNFADGEWNLSVNVSNQNFYKVSLYNKTKLEKSQNNQNVMSVDSSVFNNFVAKNPFNLSVFANNSFGYKFESILFFINDTVLPMCSGNLGDAEVFENNYFSWLVSCIDELFFSFNMSCDNGYSFYEENINNQSYVFNGSVLISNTTLCLYEYCDGHTKKNIEDLKIKKDLENKTLEIENKKLKLNFDVKNIDLIKKFDRYEFCFDFESSTKLGLISVDVPSDCYHINSNYAGHLVCPSERLWIDFVNPDVKVSVKANKVYLDLTKIKGNKVCFDSVGKFNCISGVQNFKIITVPYNLRPTPSEFSSIQQGMFWIFLLFFWLVLLLAVLVLRGKHQSTIQILNVFQMCVGFVAGVGFMKFSFIVGFAILFVAIGVLIGKIVYNE